MEVRKRGGEKEGGKERKAVARESVSGIGQ